MSHTPGEYYVAERAYWQGDVRFIRTSFDKSGVIGLTSDNDAPLFSAAPNLLEACELALENLKSICQALGEYTQPQDVEVWNKLEAAIKKARGHA